MSRFDSGDAALAAEVEQSDLKPFMALSIALPDPVAVWTGIGTIQFGGKEWIGIGGVGSIDTVGEGTDGSATGVRASLLNVPAEFRNDLEDQAVRDVLFELFVGALHEDWQRVVGVKRIWRGTLQQYDIIDGGETLTVIAGGESRAIDQRRPSIKRFTNEYQLRKYPGDRFFEYVPQMTEIPIVWAKATQTVGGAGGGGGSAGGGFGASIGLVRER